MNHLSRCILATAIAASTACGDSDQADADADADVVQTPLTEWTGTWQAGEQLYLDPATEAAYEAIHALRPDYSATEIEAMFLATADVDYTAIDVEPSTITYRNGSDVLCAARYEAAAEGEISTMDEMDLHALTLAETLQGDCSAYQHLSLTGAMASGSESHFHMTHGTTDEPLLPSPWNPALWTSTMTASAFAQLFVDAAPGLAEQLPEK